VTHWRFLLLLAVVTAVLVVAPIPTKHVAKVAVTLALESGSTVILGPSTVDQRSKCDADQRSISAMLADDLGTRVRDASDGGQTPAESANFAALALRFPAVKQVVILIDTAYLSSQSRLKRPDEAFFRVVNSAMYADAPGSYLDILKAYGGNPEPDLPFLYKGMQIPGYAAISTSWFLEEQSLMPCPENDGHNLAWVEGVTFHEEVAPPFDPADIRIFVALADAVRASGKRLLLVLLPIDVDLLGQFNPDWPKIVDRRAETVRRALTAVGLPLLDLSDTLPKDDFVDRWCGCVHLSQRGRLSVAAAIAAELQKLPSH
jgi:hypothetical protein